MIRLGFFRPKTSQDYRICAAVSSDVQRDIVANTDSIMGFVPTKAVSEELHQNVKP